MPAQSPNFPSTHSELNGAIACTTAVGHCWPCCGQARVASRRDALRFGRGEAAEGNSHLSVKHLEKGKKKSAYWLTSAWLERRKAREEGTLPGDAVLAAVKHPWLPVMTGSIMKQYGPVKMCTQPSRSIQPQETCSRAPVQAGRVESCKKSQIQSPLCPFPEGECDGSLMDSWCHLLCYGDVTSCVSQQPDCNFASFPCHFGVQEATCCWHGEPWFCACHESWICAATVHNQRIGFPVHGF